MPSCFPKVMESKHNYEALTNETLVLEIKGAAKMVVTFDERSRTEDGYVWCRFVQHCISNNEAIVLPHLFLGWLPTQSNGCWHSVRFRTAILPFVHVTCVFVRCCWNTRVTLGCGNKCFLA